MKLWLAPIWALVLAGCGHARAEQRDASGFPEPDRPVASIISAEWGDETGRENRREADLVMRAAGLRRGMTVADIGAGAGYYTVRLAAKVGPGGRVLAEDVVPATRDRLAQRVYHDQLDNVSVTLGKPADPELPPRSFDRVFMIHMYHEIAEPYAFLWRLRPALKADGLVAIVDADRETQQHGTPPKLLDCELRAVGYELVRRTIMPQAGGYLALYRARGSAPAPASIRACGAN